LDRRLLLAVGFLIMAFNSIYQYSWNALGPLISEGMGAGFQEVQAAFTLFVAVSTASQLLGGAVADARGPRGISIAAALMSAAGFLGTSASRGMAEFYASWAVGSAGEGILYGVASNVALKWFPDRRGLAVGLVSVGFGVGGAVANPFILAAGGFRAPSMAIGLVELAVLPAAASTLSYPRGLRGGEDGGGGEGRPLVDDLRLLRAGGCPAARLLELPLEDRGRPGGGGAGLAAAISAFPVASGIGRPLLGSVADRLGTLRTLALSAAAMAVGSAIVPAGLVLEGALMVGIFGGALVPLYFSAVGEIYGEAYSTSNTAALYTGKAVAGALGGSAFAALLQVGLGASAAFLVASEAAAIALLASAARLGGGIGPGGPRSPHRASRP
jgi:Major Facilitator Superfamily.